MTGQRHPARRRAAATIAAVAAAAGLIAGAAMPAGAATMEFIGYNADGGPAYGSAPNGDETVSGEFRGGLFDIEVDGVDAVAYCIDLFTGIPQNAPDYTETPWDESGVENLAIVEAILANYFPNGDGPEGFTLTGTNDEKAIATQAAIWHFTDGFTLDTSDDEGNENSPATIANYEAILAAVEAGLDGFGEPAPGLTITPPASTEGEAGSVVGPYVVSTTADSVEVVPSEGVSLVDAEGEPFTGEIVDGTELYLTSDAAVSGTISASAQGDVTAGHVFTAPGSQTLILATTARVDVSAEAVVSFTQPPPTTAPTTSTTAPPSTTSTTVPITPETSVVPPSTTVPITPNQGEGGGLPVTGAQSLLLAGVAVLLVGLGVGFRIVSRRAGADG